MSQTQTPRRQTTATDPDLGAVEGSDYEKKDRSTYDHEQDNYDGPYDVPVHHGEGKEALPAGTFDPVYEAKCRVLNRAVRWSWTVF